MRIQALIPLLALAAGPVLADTFDSGWQCIGNWCWYTGRYQNSFGQVTNFNPAPTPDNYCPPSSVGGMVEFCIDFSQHRGHFRFEWECCKRCWLEKRVDVIPCGDFWYCGNIHYDEGACSWRRDVFGGLLGRAETTYSPVPASLPPKVRPATAAVKAKLDKEAREHGFNREKLEKIYRDGMKAEGLSTDLVKRSVRFLE